MPLKKKMTPELSYEKTMVVAGVALPVHISELFKLFLNLIPEKTNIAWLFMHHPALGPDGFSKDVLQTETDLPVHDLTGYIHLRPDEIYLIPADKWVAVKNNELVLIPPPDPAENGVAVDILFRSLAEIYKESAMAIVLSGSATDRLMGLKEIKAFGGITFLESSALPEANRQTAEDVAASGAIDFILPADAIVQKIKELRRSVNPLLEEDKFIELSDDIYKQLLAMLQIRRGTDFTYYKQSTIRRRILRRMGLHKKETAEAYLEFVTENKTEQDALYQDLLIPVTSFFRDPKSFDDLCDNVFKMLVKDKSQDKPIRIWVAGCSTGEEAYSIAICLKEYLDERVGLKKEVSFIKVQIFATDISEPAITKARSGLYSKGELDGISEDRLYKFFVQYNGGYQIKKQIRDMCVFAHHNLITDPPFARIDLVSCRNVLIYMEPYLQKKILSTFHYALKEDGFLLLGKSETTGGSSELFTSFDKQNKIYMRKDMPSRFMPIRKQRAEHAPSDMDTTMKNESSRPDFQKTADDIILSKYAPAGVIINEQMDIVHFRGSTGIYLEPSPGKPSLNLLKMARPGLAFELRNVLHKAKSGKEPAIKENIPVMVNDQQRLVTIEAISLSNTIEPHYLILFHDSTGSQQNGGEPSSEKKSKGSRKAKTDHRDHRIQQLEQELAHLRDDMRSITEEMEASNEEMQSTNEELLSSSEELQSLNEELETTNAELQSANEELMLLNQQLIDRNEQLNQARQYAEAIITTIREPLIILNKNLRVIGANNAFYRTFGGVEKEITGKLFFEFNNYQWNIPALRLQLEKALPENGRLEDIEFRHRFAGLGERTLLLNAREIESDSTFEKLYLLAIQDITDSRYTKALIQSENRFKSLVEAIPQIVWMTDAEGNMEYVNEHWYEYTGTDPDNFLKNKWDNHIHHADVEHVTRKWNLSFKTGQPLSIEYRLRGADGEYRWFLNKGVPIHDADGRIVKWFGTSTNIDDQKNVEAIIKESEERLRIAVESTGVGPWDFNPETGKLIWGIRCRELFGLSPDAYVDYNVFLNGLHPDDREAVDRTVNEALKGINEGNFNIEHRTIGIENGQLRWLRATGKAYFNEEGKASRFIGIMQDITDEKQIEQTLKDSEEYFRKMADNTPVKMWVTDAEGLCTYLNKRWYDYTGQTVEQALGFGWLQAVHPDDLARAQETFMDVTRKHIPLNMEYRLRSKEGRYKWVLDAGMPRFDLLGNFIGYVGAIIDINARKLAEESIVESERRFRAVADTAPVLIWTSGPDKQTDFFNKGWLDFTGRTMEESLGSRWLEAIHPEDVDRCNNTYTTSFDARRSFHMEYRLRRYDGEYRWISDTGIPRFLADGIFAGYIGACVDIHEQKLTREELERMIEKRTHDLKYANAELKLTNQNLEQFAYVASHDLQEPLRKIQTFVELLREKSKDILTTEHKTYMERIATSADRMKTLISDLLTFSRLSDHEESFIASDLGKILNDVLVDFDLLISQKNAVITADPLPMVEAIPMQMHQLFYNLLNNALKFSRKDVPPVIHITSHELSRQELAQYTSLNQQLKYYEIIVQDNGIGFSPQYSEIIFTIFQRLHGRSQYEGTGIGLALCRKIMNNHQGEIFARGVENEGAAFHVIIPARQVFS